MRLRGDDRAQTVQVGAVLLFATLVVAISMYQASVVPQENQSVEYAAYEDASADLTHLRNAMLAASSGDGARGVTVKTGAQYPSRILFVNPLDPMGALETTAASNVTIGNVNANASEHVNAGEYVANESGNLTYTTRRLRFTPDYNELPAADVVWNNGFVYRTHSRPTPLASQTLVRGNTVTVTTLAGDLDAGGYTTPVTAVPVSAHVNTITVTNESDDPITLTVPTRLNATEWEQRVLAGQTDQFVTGVSDGPREGTVTVELEPGEQYELRVARVELKERGDAESVTDPPARYLVSEVDRELEANSDGRAKLVVQARDALNNPVSNWNVTFDASGDYLETQTGDELGDSETLRTNENGNAVVWVNKTNSATSVDVTATLGDDTSTSDDSKNVTHTVSESASGSGTSSGTEAYAVDWLESEIANQDDVVCSGESCTFNASESASITLFADSIPRVVGGGFQYAVGNTSVGTVSPEEDTTNASGRSSTSFTATTNGTTNVFVSGGGSGDRLALTVTGAGAGGPTGQTTAYPDVYNDWDGSVGANEDNSIPPGGNARGTVSNFQRMQSSQRADQYEGFATFETNYPSGASSHQMDIGTATYNVSTTGTDYTLEVEYRFYNSNDANPGDYEIYIVDANGNVLQSESITNIATNPATKQISLNSAAEQLVKNKGAVYVRYERGPGGYSQILIYYQRVNVS